jgi:hypothetical protein
MQWSIYAIILCQYYTTRFAAFSLPEMPPVVPEYPLHRKSMLLPPEDSPLDGMIGQQQLAFTMESPKSCEELTGM